MSGFWKVTLTFVCVLGAAAIIYQLNQGTLAQTGASTFSQVVSTAFKSAPTSSTNSTGGATPSGNGSSGSNKNSSTVNHSTTN